MNNELVKQILSNILKIKGVRNYTKGLKEMPEVINFLKEKYGDLELPELFYLGLNNGSDHICNYGNKKKFNTLEKGYRFCSMSCECKRENQSNKIKVQWDNRTQEERDHVFEKMKMTNIEKYGVENVVHNDEIRKRIIQTNNEKYGSDHPFGSDIVKEKIKKTNNEKYGSDHPFGSDIIKEKIKKTNLEKYNVEHTMYIAQKAFKDQNDGLNPFQVEEIKEKIDKVMLDRYGVTRALKNKEIISKMNQKNYEKYKRNNVSQLHISDKYYEILNNKEKFIDVINNKTLNEIKEILPISEGAIVRHARRYNVLENILISSKSQYEEEIAKFLNENNINYKKNDKKILNGLELDFLFLDYPVAIEFNSLIFHSEFGNNFRGFSGKDKHYHSKKTDDCLKHGIQLIHIFEDEWNQKKDIIKHKILSLAKKLPKGVGARKISVRKIEFSQEKEFLEKYHIQGSTRDRRFGYGAFHGEEIVGVLTIGKSKKDEWEVKRFASNNKNNPGLFSKMLNHFIKEYNPETVVTFADRRYSLGKLYEKTGFVEIERLGENYFYTNDYQKRLNKELFRKERIARKFNIDITGKTELELMLSLGYDRIWDAGKIKYEYRVNCG